MFSYSRRHFKRKLNNKTSYFKPPKPPNVNILNLLKYVTERLYFMKYIAILHHQLFFGAIRIDLVRL